MTYGWPVPSNRDVSLASTGASLWPRLMFGQRPSPFKSCCLIGQHNPADQADTIGVGATSIGGDAVASFQSKGEWLGPAKVWRRARTGPAQPQVGAPAPARGNPCFLRIFHMGMISIRALPHVLECGSRNCSFLWWYCSGRFALKIRGETCIPVSFRRGCPRNSLGTRAAVGDALFLKARFGSLARVTPYPTVKESSGDLFGAA